MKKKIKVGSGFGKRPLNEAIDIANPGDIIVVDPGTYTYLDGLKLNKDISIVGNGSEPSDVIIQGKFWISGNNVTLKHFKVVTTTGNTINISNKGMIHAEQMIIEGIITGEFPPIWLEENSVMYLQSSEVEFHGNKSGVCLSSNSQAYVSRSIIDSIYISESTLQMENSQIKTTLHANQAIINAKEYIELLGLDTTEYSIYLDNGTRAEFEQLVFSESSPEIDFVAIDSYLKVLDLDVGKQEAVDIKVTEKTNLVIDEQLVNKYVYDEDTQEYYYEGVKPELQQILNKQDHVESASDSQEQNYTEDSVDLEDIEDALDLEDINVEQETTQTPLEKLENLQGLSMVKDQVKRFIGTVQFNEQRKNQGMKTNSLTLHSMFLGNPGTGKTTVARLLGEILYQAGVVKTSKFVEVDRSMLVSQYVGQTAVQTQEVLESAKGGILLIDEAYTLYSDSSKDTGSEAVDTILKYMEDQRDDIMIIFAGYTDKMQNFINMNPGLRSRVPNIFDFEDYTGDDVADIGFKNLLADEYAVDEEKYKTLVKYQYSHTIDRSNARWVRNFNEKLITIMSNRVINTQDTDYVTITDSDINELSGGNVEEKEERVKKLLEKLNNMVGLDSIKQEVANLIKEAEVDKQLSKVNPTISKPTYHMLFTGNPGTGKTTVAEIIAKLFNAIDILPSSNVKVVERSDLVGAYIGHTEKQTKAIIEEAMGGVLFIDEAYQLTQGSSSGNDFGKLAVETLLTALENYRDKFIVIFAGYTKEMETFLDTNPGLRSRVPKKIEFPDYTPEEVAQIVHLILNKQWQYNEVLLKSVVSKLYEQCPESEKSNGRWARNLADQIISRQKHYIIDTSIEQEKFNVIPDALIEQLYRELNKSEI